MGLNKTCRVCIKESGSILVNYSCQVVSQDIEKM